MAKREKIEFRYSAGKLMPASKYAASLLDKRKFTEGQVIRAELSKLRSGSLNKHAHNIGKLCYMHLDDFAEYDGRAHDAIKRLQLEAGIECDEYMIRVDGLQHKVMARQARSFSYENMGEERFNDAIKGICRYISEKYWPSCTDEQIEYMANNQVDE